MVTRRTRPKGRKYGVQVEGENLDEREYERPLKAGRSAKGPRNSLKVLEGGSNNPITEVL